MSVLSSIRKTGVFKGTVTTLPQGQVQQCPFVHAGVLREGSCLHGVAVPARCLLWNTGSWLSLGHCSQEHMLRHRLPVWLHTILASLVSVAFMTTSAPLTMRGPRDEKHARGVCFQAAGTCHQARATESLFVFTLSPFSPSIALCAGKQGL